MDDRINTNYGSKVSGCCKTEFDKEETFKKIFKDKLIACTDNKECIDNYCKKLDEKNMCLEASDLRKKSWDKRNSKCGYISNKDIEWNPKSNLKGNTCRRKDIADEVVTKCEIKHDDCLENRCNNKNGQTECKNDENCIDTYRKEYTNSQTCRSGNMVKKEIGYDPRIKSYSNRDCSLQCMYNNKICPKSGANFSATMSHCCQDKDFSALAKNKPKLDSYILNYNKFC